MPISRLAAKLQIKPGQRIVIINPPPGYINELGQLPEGVEMADQPTGKFDFVHLFARNTEELNRLAPKAIRAVSPDGLLWISYPKGSSGIQSDLTRDAGWDILHEAGLENVTQVSINEVWSAGRFRPLEQVSRKKV